MRKLIFYFLVSLAFALSGCAGVMNPYHSSFSCPNYKNGKCVSVEEAYKESTGQTYHDLWTKGQLGKAAPSEADRYQSALYGRLSGLLRSPVSPVVVPPQVMRVLILPYTGRDNELYMQRYVYLFLSDPKWLLSDEGSEGGK